MNKEIKYESLHPMLKFNVSSREHISYLTIGTHIGYLEGHVKSGWFLNDIYPQIEGVGFFFIIWTFIYVNWKYLKLWDNFSRLKYQIRFKSTFPQKMSRLKYSENSQDSGALLDKFGFLFIFIFRTHFFLIYSPY